MQDGKTVGYIHKQLGHTNLSNYEKCVSPRYEKNEKRSFPKVQRTYEKPQLKIHYVSKPLSPYSKTQLYQWFEGIITCKN